MLSALIAVCRLCLVVEAAAPDVIVTQAPNITVKEPEVDCTFTVESDSAGTLCLDSIEEFFQVAVNYSDIPALNYVHQTFPMV